MKVLWIVLGLAFLPSCDHSREVVPTIQRVLDFGHRLDKAQGSVHQLRALVARSGGSPAGPAARARLATALGQQDIDLDTMDLVQLPTGRLRPMLLEVAGEAVSRCGQIRASKARLRAALAGALDSGAAKPDACAGDARYEAKVLLGLIDGHGTEPSFDELARRFHTQANAVGR